MIYPKISIITPNYNNAKYLEETICSVLNQGYPNLEYIIIDGGSADGSIDIIKKYEKNLFYWISESDSGMYEAIKKGFDKSTGNIMGWINSDDLLDINCLYNIANYFTNNPNILWVEGVNTIIDNNNYIIKQYDPPKRSLYNYLSGSSFFEKKTCYIQQESTFWTRTLWLQIDNPFDQSLKYAGDFDLWMKFFLKTKLYFMPIPLGKFRYSGFGQLSVDNKHKYQNEVEYVIRNIFHKLPFYKKLYVSLLKIFIKVVSNIFNKKMIIHIFNKRF